MLQNIEKLKGDPSGIFIFENSLTLPKKLKGGPCGIFQHSVAKHQKIEAGTLFRKSRKSLTMPRKTEMRDPLTSPGMVCYAEKEEKPFLFS